MSEIVYVGETNTESPKELSDAVIAEIHSGLLTPNPEAIHSMAREIRKWRGNSNPDGV